MIFVPVYDAWERNFLGKGFKINLYAQRPETQVFSGITQPQQAAAFTGRFGKVTDLLQGNTLSIIFAYNTEAGRAAVFRVWLAVKRKRFQLQ